MKFIILISIISFMSCSPDNRDKSQKQTEIFTNYLRNNFGENISDELQYFILISNFPCAGCVEKYLHELNEYININNSDHFTFIASDLKVFPESLSTKTRILIDNTSKYDYLNLDIANITLIEMKGGKITFKKSFKAEDSPVTAFIKPLE